VEKKKQKISANTMKSKLFLLTILFSPHFVAFSQYSAISKDGLSPPLKPNYERVMADTVYNILHIPNSYDSALFCWDGTHPLIAAYTEIKHDKNGLVDTLWLHSGASRIDVIHHDENQRIVCVETNFPSCKIDEWLYSNCDYYYLKEEFEYDSQNRISKKTTSEISSISGKVNIDIWSVEIPDYSTLFRTKKGYVFDGYEFELDELNRVVYRKNLNMPDEYMELNGKKYRVGDSYYIYFEGGFSLLSCDRQTQGTTDYWRKTEVISIFRRDT